MQIEKEYISRSQKKRDSLHLQELGEKLVSLPKNKLKDLPISEDLQVAVLQYHNLKSHEAKRRHLQFIGRLMRAEEHIKIIEDFLSSLQLH